MGKCTNDIHYSWVLMPASGLDFTARRPQAMRNHRHRIFLLDISTNLLASSKKNESDIFQNLPQAIKRLVI